MVKKVCTLAFGLIAAVGLMAQSAPKSVTINQSDIQYWVGAGSNSTVVAIGWDDDDASYTPTVVVWGIHWNGTITLLNALDSIAAYDSRFSYTISGSFLNGLSYNDPNAGVSLTPSAGWNCNNYNGVYGSTSLSTTWLRISESTCDNYNFTGVNNLIYASDPNAGSSLPDTVDASLPFSEILYWVGTGTDSAEFIVNFAQPDTAFAWGYLFNGTTTAQAMIDAIAAADPRFWTVGTPSVSGDIHFVTDNGDTLGLSPVDPSMGYNFWWTNRNGVSASSGTAATIQNGDVFKYGDLNSATGWDYMYGYYLEEAWNTIPTPVSVPQTTSEVVEATIAASDILYWVGTGTNEAILAVNWADTALAWGYRWNGTATVESMMTDIAAADPRFSYSGTGFLDNITFNDGTVSLAGTPGNYWGSTKNGMMDLGLAQTLANGDFEKWGDPAAGVAIDSTYDSIYNYWWYTYAYPMTIHPVSVPGAAMPVDATIAVSDILFWVGHGENEAILAVNWADTALAWGYRFSADSVSSATMLADIAAADPRLTVDGAGMVSDIRYIDTAAGMTDTLGITSGNWWGSLLNGYSDMGTGQVLRNGDLQKWGDPAAGVIVDSMEWDGYWYYSYVYPMTIHPVTVPDTTGSVPPVNPEHGPFCGAVGTEGCTAIKADSSAIVAWATGVTITRGPRTIANPDGSLASFGDETNAIGPATMDNTMDAVSLGDGGSALVTFAHSIRNGEGPDFAVYENAFGDGSLELAFVEVSSDGQRFVRFPATCLTQTETQLGNAGQTDPTNINNLAGKFRIGYGTPFDLDELADSTGINIDSIVYVRIVDVVGSIDPQYGTYDAFGHIINDPWPTPFEASGYDLTGVAVLHQNGNVGIDDVVIVEGLWPNPTADRVNVSLGRAAEGVLFDQTGRMVAAYSLTPGLNTLDLSALAHGVYILRVDGTATKIVKR